MKTILNTNYYTIAEIAKMLDCTTQSIRNYIKAGKLKKDTKIGRSIYISEGNIKAFLQREQ